ncbi:tetratricopeptide repeat protein [Burkholderia cepacia]|uniref:Tetratricopeptide repeat protein n=1 Tax=Burkholderia cepacia TaxID=292 RepID=A0A8I1ALH4_BURCE|nr:tetratricopeptide repeat protein [Burkholderia cepacia]MBA9895542.1 hypothetical protein [Burkholderia cepacia]MBA9942077.1 hypothetical protein [Burkholderia cepacia]MBA9972193.1 hypothetical protein [Burkholderia cepacia]MBA9990765.1 hypothetical protein [Burkholderia cepacia]MBA9998847.1 hypothetical protein [Burkholderia cepacia]
MMIIDKLTSEKGNLIVPPAQLNVVLVEEREGALSAPLPLLEDLTEIDRLKKTQFSLNDAMSRDRLTIDTAFSIELNEQLKKRHLHEHSPIYHHRLASLANLSGLKDLEEQFLRRAAELGKTDWYADRVGEGLIARGQYFDAEQLFSSRDLESDVHANLRLAFLQVRRQEYDSATRSLERAIRIDPFDYGARLFQGSLSLLQGNADEAVRAFRIAEDSRPNSSVLNANFAIAYVSLGKFERALGYAKRSVALDPLNRNAVGILADLAFREKSNEDAIPALRYFVRFEQRDAQVWAQLARALLEMGSFDEAIAALRHQGSLTDSPEVWNNLGVAYHRKGRSTVQKAIEAFAYATGEKWETNTRSSQVALRNLSAILFGHGAHDRVIKITDRLGTSLALQKEALTDGLISDLFVFRILSLMNRGFLEEAANLAEALVDAKDVAVNLKTWVVAWLIAFYALRDNPRAIELSNRFIGLFWEPEAKPQGRAEGLMNNIAYAFAEVGDIDRAYEYLNIISNKIHKDPYPTATLGFLHLRRGNLESGLALYEEAIGLAHVTHDKSRIRQKMYLELARAKWKDNPAVARRNLEKAIAIVDGSPELVQKAKNMQRSLN